MCKKLLIVTSFMLALCFASTTIGQPEAHDPIPADGATNVSTPVTLRWTPGDVVVWREAMQRLVDFPDELARLRQNVRTPLSLEEHTAALAILYAHVIAGNLSVRSNVIEQ